MRSTILCLATALLAATSLSVAGAGAGAAPNTRARRAHATQPLRLTVAKAQARLTHRILHLKVGWQGRSSGGKLVLRLIDLRGKVVSQKRTVLGPSSGLKPTLKFKMWLPATARHQVDLLRFRYRYVPKARGTKRRGAVVSGVVALSEILDRHFVWIRGHKTLTAGSRAGLRVIVRDAAGKKLAGIRVTLLLRQGRKTVRTSVRTGRTGTGNLVLKVPLAWGGKGARLTAKTRGSFVQRFSSRVQILHRVKVLLTTNKPIYQPGQVIWTRLLTLRSPSRRPHANASVTLLIRDGKGNIVFRKKTRTDSFGVAWSRFQLAGRGCHGTYSVQAKVDVPNGDDIVAQKRVKVYRYQLPRFKIGFGLKQAYVEPGKTLVAKITARYLTGKPVPGGRVLVRIYNHHSLLTSVTARTRPDGSYLLRWKIPPRFLKGRATGTLHLKAVIHDPAGHRRQRHQAIPVVKEAIKITAVHENQGVVLGVPQKIYLVASLPDGKSVRSQLTVKFTDRGRNGKKRTTAHRVQTDAYGVAEVTVTPHSAPLNYVVTASNAQGQRGTSRGHFSASSHSKDLLIRPVKALYQGTETLVVDVFSRAKWAPVYLDVIQNQQIVRSAAAVIQNGRARIRIPLGPLLEGSLRLSAYQLTPGGGYDKAFRWVLVKPQRQLRVLVRQDRAVYRPGQSARLSFRVVDERGRGAEASLGVEITDSAVYALAGSPPALRQTSFMLAKVLLNEQLQLNGIGPAALMAFGRQRSRRRAEQALLAMESAQLSYPLNQNGQQSYIRYRKGLQRKLKKALKPVFLSRFRTYARAHRRYWLNQYIKQRCAKMLNIVSLDVLVKASILKPAQRLDPWGRPLQLVSNCSCCSCNRTYRVFLKSPGPDGKYGTEDDLTLGPYVLKKPKRPQWIAGCRRGMGCGCGGGGFGLGGRGFGVGRYSGGSGSGWGVGLHFDKTRQHFPESLYVNPSLRTDHRGRVAVKLTMADSITNWVMTAFASDKTGRLGSLIKRIRVFKEFFADVNLPQTLTRHDEIEVPVAIHNHLKSRQNVRVRLKPAAWFKVMGRSSHRVISVRPGAIGVARFRIKATRVGHWKLTVQAVGQSGRYAVSRRLRVRPEGRPYRFSKSGTLQRRLATTADIPRSAIPGSERLTVKIQPEILSVVLDGLGGLLAMPHGCFEQTSSTTYPNIMVLSYLKRAKGAHGALRKKALRYIGKGYQRLLSFEVNRRGFSLFGQAPANPILTAYGLQEFADMSKVHYVDPAVLRRTRRYLRSIQRKDGSWRNAGRLIESGANSAQGRLAATAYIAWSLGRTGKAHRSVSRAVRFLRKHAHTAWGDPYALSLMAHAASHAKGARHRPFVRRLLKQLATLKKTDRQGNHYWSPVGSQATVMSGRGRSASIETTAMVLEVLLRHRAYLPLARRVTPYLLAAKDPRGAWYTTQATVLSLRALLKAKRVFSRRLPRGIDVFLDGRLAETVKLGRTDAGITFKVDLSTGLKPGKHTVRIQPRGRGTVLYQVAHGYHLPPGKRASPRLPPTKSLQIRVALSHRRVRLGGLVTARVTLGNKTGRTLSAPVAELGTPPGFAVLTADLDRLVRGGQIQRYERTPGRLVLYFTQLKRVHTRLSYRLQARRPARVTVGGATFYEYYFPERIAHHPAQRLSAFR